MTLPAAGWFPDPQDRARLRWWDGRTWAGQTRPAPGVLAPSTTHTAERTTAGPSFSVTTASAVSIGAQAWAYGPGIARTASGSSAVVRWSCVWVWGALAFALASVVLDPWGLLSLLGLGFGVVAVAAPRATGAWRVAGRSIAISAMVLAVGTAFVEANTLFGVFGALDALPHLF